MIEFIYLYEMVKHPIKAVSSYIQYTLLCSHVMVTNVVS